jgi:hypothetical protein
MGSRAALTVVLMLLAVVASGCTSDESGPAPEPSSPAAGSDDNGTQAPAPPVPYIFSSYLSSSSELVESPPGAGAVTAAGSYAAIMGGTFHVNEFKSAPMNRTLLMMAEKVTFTLWVKATKDVPSTTAFDYAVWFGTTQAMPLGKIVNDGQNLAAGQVVKKEIDVAWVGEPLWIVKGDSLRFLFVSGKAHEETGNLQLLYGGATPSAINFTALEVLADPTLNIKPGDEQTL